MGKLTCETYPVILGHEPIASNALADTSDWISLEGAKGVLITIIELYTVAANALVLTVHQGATGAGTTAFATGAEFKIWSNLDCATSDTMVRRTDAVTYTLTGTGAGSFNLCQIYVDASLLTNGYKWVQLGASDGDAGNLVTVLYQIEGGRYQQTTPPTYIA
jgi:hypothetical protein